MLSNSREDKNLKALDILLKDKPDDYKGRVLEYVLASGIDADDPTFILLAAQGSLDVALVKLPIELRGIVAQVSSGMNTVLQAYAYNAACKQEEGELLEAKFTALVEKQIQEIVKLTTTVEKLEQKLTKFTAIEEKLEQLPSQLSEMVTEAMREIVLANDKHDRQVVDTIVTNSTQLADTIVANSTQLAGNLTETMYMHHSNSKTSPIWQVTSWKAPQWIGATSVGLISLAIGVKFFQIDSKIDLVLAGTVTNNEIVNSVYKKVEQDNIKLRRIEKNLGIEPTKKKQK